VTSSWTPGDAGRYPLRELVGAGLLVPLVHGGEARYANLDYAASAPSLAQVAARVAEVLPWYSSVHRGSGYLSLVSTSLYESARATLHRFLGARTDDVVIFTRNTTDSLNLLAEAVPNGSRPKGREIVYLDIEHHANLLPWQSRDNHCVIAGGTLEETLDRLEAALEKSPVSLVAITGASNVTGEAVPLSSVVQMAHAHGARVAVDGAQLAPHRRIDLSALDADYLALSGHKCYAPFGAGVLVGRRDWLDEAPAHLAGGGAIERVTVEHTDWASAPDRHEGGTPNAIGAIALAEASIVLDELLTDGSLAAHEDALRRRLVAGLGSLPGVRLLRIWEDSTDAVGVVAFEVVGHEPGLVATYLASEHGLGVRAGKFCAHPLIDRINAGRSALRASVGIGTVTEDVDRLVDGLESYLDSAPVKGYSLVDGSYAPDEDDRWAPLPGVDLRDPSRAPVRSLRQ
jgi:selenocysteine lyase/cysteine desulfurase